jgi:site-specific recombinase XerD
VFPNRHVRKLMDENGFEDICFHTLRHSFASTLRTMGTDDRTIQALGGWESAQSMQQYAHIGNAELIAASNDLSKLL